MVITSGVRDKVRQGMLVSNNYVYSKICFCGIPTKPFAIVYIMHSLASFLRLDRDINPNV